MMMKSNSATITMNTSITNVRMTTEIVDNIVGSSSVGLTEREGVMVMLVGVAASKECEMEVLSKPMCV